MIAFDYGKILPAVTLEESCKAMAVARAISAGGIKLMEITFRTLQAAESISIIRKGLEDMVVGAGTLLTKEALHRAKDAGAQFGLSPGFNPYMIEEAEKINFPFIPGVMTPGEIEQCLTAGYKILKVFPIEQVGGVHFLKAMAGPYTQTGVHFIPMGGINVNNMQSYLSLNNVVSIGGSWLAAKTLIKESNFDHITNNIKDALELAGNAENI